MNETNNPDVQQAVSTLVKVLFPHISAEQIEATIGAIFIIARVLRKAVPDNVQNGIIGTILKHCALEVNPKTNSQPTPTVKTTENK